MTDDDYWSKPCVCCRSEERNRTNLECVTEVAETTGTPLEEAKKVFRRPEFEMPKGTEWDVFKREYMKEVEQS